VGYADAARLAADYIVTTVRDFTLADVELLLTHWHRLVAVGQMGLGETAETYAALQTRQGQHIHALLRPPLSCWQATRGTQIDWLAHDPGQPCVSCGLNAL
jgi:hypothetical protein